MRSCIYLLILSCILNSIRASSQEIVLNEVMAENESSLTDFEGDRPDWIELYNAGSVAIDLEGFRLSDDYAELDKWHFPEITINSGEFLILFCSGEDTVVGAEVHTNFKLSSVGEEIILSAGNGQVLDELRPIPLGADLGYARVTDGNSEWARFEESTPNASNSTISSVVFSHPPGYYENEFLLELTSTVGHEIRFTVNGSEPNENSSVYTSAIPILDQIGSPSMLSGIATSLSWDPPTGTFPKANVIRARTFSNGMATSPVFSKTYMVNPEFETYLLDYPIVSIITDSLHLFDYDSGLFVPGINYNPGNSQWTGNYFEKGIEWERNSHVEYFETEELEWAQYFGLRIHGGKTRGAPQKSLRLYAREELGAKKFNHAFFDTKDKQVFDKVILRAHFGCWNQTMIKDGLTGYIARNLDFDSQHSKPVIVLINGEYWGIQTIRDYYDSNYIEEEHDVDKEDVNILLHGAGTHPDFPPEWGVVEGSHADYVALMEFIENNPLSESSNYEYVTTQIDVSSMIEYFCTAIYFNHKDWPTNNHKVWRGTSDTKWRWLLYDFDSGWGYTNVANNSILYAAHPTGSTIYNPPYATFLFRKMLESEEFRIDFVSRYACLMNNEFSEDTVAAAIDRFEDLYDPNALQHINRWHHTTSYSNWQSRINSKLRSFNQQRRDYAIAHVSDWFNINFDPDDYDCNEVVINVEEANNTSDELFIYPNPSSDAIWIDYSLAAPDASIKVYDLNGRMVAAKPYDFHMHLPVSELSPGIYFLTIENRGERITAKFVRR